MADETLEVSFEPSANLPFAAGQYIYISIPGLAGDPKGAGDGRTFSICSSPNSKRLLSFAFRTGESAFKQSLATAPFGTVFEAFGPFGNFILPKDHTRPLVFVAGGIGLTPFLSMVRYAAEEKLPHNIFLLYANKSAKRAAYLDELEKAQKQNPNFSVKLHIGEVDEGLLSDIKNKVPEGRWYVSGPPVMTDGIRDILVKTGIPEQDVYYEECSLALIIDAIERIRILDQSSDGVLLADLRGVVKYVNPAWEKLTGWNAGEVIDKVTPRIIKSGRHDKNFYVRFWQMVLGGDVFREEIINKRKNGDLYDTDEIIFPIKNISGGFIGLAAFQRDITDRKHSEAKIKELNQLRNKFIAIVSHQLRTPLNSIRWNLEMLLEEEMGKLTKAQKEFIRLTYTADTTVIKRISDLLTAMDIEEGRVAILKDNASLESLLTSVIAEYRKDCEMKKEITCEYTPSATPLPTVSIDSEKIRQVFAKLVENAVIYTPEKGRITAKLFQRDDWLRFEITDTGIGIPAAEQDKIFTRFYRASNASVMMPDASGLGLAIAKYYVEQHGGKIGFISEEGKGSTFWFELPVK